MSEINFDDITIQDISGFWCKKSIKLGHTDITTLQRCVIGMKKPVEFKWKHYQPEMILLTVRWYLRYNLSFRDLVEMMEERGLSIAHTTIMRWIHQYGPELDKKIRRHLKQTNDSWRVDETYIKVKDNGCTSYPQKMFAPEPISYHLTLQI